LMHRMEMQRMEWAAGILALCGILAPCALAQHPIMEIKVSGNQRLPAAAVIAASGLRQGQAATHADLDKAAAKLAQTGLFSSVSYQYDPRTVGGVTGYALVLLVSEDTALATVVLDFPGEDAERLWQRLRSSDRLIDQRMPDNDRALDYFKRALEAALRKSNQAQEIVMKSEANLGSGRMTVVFRPAHLARVAAIRFEGNSAIAEAKLQAGMAKVEIGEEYSERDFRKKLELNLRPLYEDLGRLTMSFPRVTTAPAGDSAVTVTAAVDEGPGWRLGTVELTGDHLPLADMHDAVRFERGAAANWKEFMASVTKLEQVLRRDGYITVSSKPARAFHEDTQVVDVGVAFAKGPRYLFGELHIEGLDAATQQRLTALWQLPAGAPMNQPYIDEFVRSSWPLLKNKFRTFNSDLHIRPGQNIVDVTLKFR
jgi:outer membrane protein assembly factor BamA